MPEDAVMSLAACGIEMLQQKFYFSVIYFSRVSNILVKREMGKGKRTPYRFGMATGVNQKRRKHCAKKEVGMRNVNFSNTRMERLNFYAN